jgi:hypothetical protein
MEFAEIHGATKATAQLGDFMGYNTLYSLKCDFLVGGQIAQLKDVAPLSEVIRQLREESEDAHAALDVDGSSEESIKWYEHEEVLRNFSALNPGVLFTLHGEGEENDDIWNKYFLNGKLQVAKASVQIAPFDAKQLK